MKLTFLFLDFFFKDLTGNSGIKFNSIKFKINNYLIFIFLN